MIYHSLECPYRRDIGVLTWQKKITSLEKDRQDLQLTIDSLQEEKKLLQTKLRKTSGNGKFTDVKNNPSNRKDVSTSTEDLRSRRKALNPEKKLR
ncbi:unnamed protein product [Thlaspi arvense]|uniref:Uncharacterized protein n=1 Tax=Thlaspi arvense TaxID=13288 RepID=A0AAU9T8C0_THLAR|nr:unnamed protein product [Thlaspi arvense]